MTLVLNIEENLPPPLIEALSLSAEIPVHRVGNFYDEKTTSGCGTECIWNGGGYYMEIFVCGQTYPSEKTFYCCSDCHSKVGASEKVFLSYRWCDSEIADKVTNSLRGAGVEVIRDRNEMHFLDDISAFMGTAGQSRYFVSIVTESYFYSRHCMYEFCQLVESDQAIRTIAVMLGDAVEPGVEERLQSYWHEKRGELQQAVNEIDDIYAGYLRSEIGLLARNSGHVANFYAEWRAIDRPKGSRWLVANCLYLVGAIKTTFKPTEEDASNWTYSNNTVRAEVAADLPPAAIWNPEPFYLHAHSEVELQTITQIPRARDLMLAAHLDGLTREVMQPGVHLVLVNAPALRSLSFCTRVLGLLDRPDITVVPMFLDEMLQKPAGEVTLLKEWYTFISSIPDVPAREEVDKMLRRFGPLVERLRNTLVPPATVIFGSASK